MNLHDISQLARSQGPVFWIATAAIALGATLLVVALVQQLRRSVGNRLERARSFRMVQAVPKPDSVPEADVYEATPSLAVAPPALRATLPPAVGDDPGDYSLALLLRRLQSAGDRLEEIAGDLNGEIPPAEESGLKEDLQDVEYVFRASGP